MTAAGAGATHSNVPSAGTPTRTGGMLSTIVTTCVATLLAPQRSVATQRRVRTWLPGQDPCWIVSVNTSDGAGSQSSVTVGVGIGGTDGHSALRVGGMPEIVGGLLSTRMTCARCDVLPQESLAVQVRTRRYSSSQRRSVRVSRNVTLGFGSQVSVAVTAAGGGIALHGAVVSGGTP